MEKASEHVGCWALGRRLFSFAWAVGSTAYYGLCVILFGYFSKRRAWRISRTWARQIFKAAGVRYSVAGLERLEPGRKYLFVSNHQSHLDIPLMLAVLPWQLSFIAKKELFRVPIFGQGIRSLGHISIDRSSARRSRESFIHAAERLRNEDMCVVIFPEGTRSETGALGEFKRGSFTLAVEAGLPVVPLAVVDTRLALPKGKRLIRAATCQLRVGAPIENPGPNTLDKEALVEKARRAIEALLAAT